MDDAVEIERKRCAGIVQLARAGDIDQDFRSIIHRIESGDTVDEIKAEIAERQESYDRRKASERGNFDNWG